MIIDELFEQWLVEIQKKFKASNAKWKKAYTHFSFPFTKFEDIIALKWFLLDPDKIKNYDFLPLLSFFQKTPIFQKRVKWSSELKREGWKHRPLMYADHLDSLIYSWYSFLLSHYYEKKLSEYELTQVVSAYRRDSKKRTNVSIAKEMFDFISTCPPDKNWDVLLFDVEKFYDTLDPVLLKKRWASLFSDYKLSEDQYSVFRSVTEYWVVLKSDMLSFLNSHYKSKYQRAKGKVCSSEDFYLLRKSGVILSKWAFLKNISPIIDPKDKDRFYNLVNIDWKRFKGIPQGLPISPTLANIYMLEFDSLLNKSVSALGGLYRRYADDIAIVCPEEDSAKMKDFIYKTISDSSITGLNIQSKKTQHYRYNNWNIYLVDWSWDKGAFTYLWLTYSKSGGRIKSGTIARFYQRLIKHIHSNLQKIRSWKGYASKSLLIEKALSWWTYNYIRLCVKELWSEKINRQINRRKVKRILNHVLYGKALIIRTRVAIADRIDNDCNILDHSSFTLSYSTEDYVNKK